MGVMKFIAYNKGIIRQAMAYGWLPAARYTNLRDVKGLGKLGLLDIDWKNYNFKRHLQATESIRPFITVARDVESKNQLKRIIDQAFELNLYADFVVIVPKDVRLSDDLNEIIPGDFLLGYSVPSKYGGTKIAPKFFKRPVHLLGGRPDIQRNLGKIMPVVSFDCNRFTLDASFGDYFDGEIFRPHPIGGYQRCISDSLANITALWNDYHPKFDRTTFLKVRLDYA